MSNHTAHHNIPGRYFEGQNSTATNCALIIDDGTVYLQTDDGRYKSNHCQMGDIKIDAKVGNIARKVYMPDGIVFETDMPEMLDGIKPHKFWQFMSRTERLGWHLVPLAIITPFAAFALYKLLIPAIISIALFMTPDGMLPVVDKNSLKSIDFVLTDPSELPEQRQGDLKVLFAGLVASSQTARDGSKGRNYKYNLQFRSSKHMGPNAFALPGGTIVLMDELVEKFSEDYILAAVLAHEIGHVENQHSLKQIYRAFGVAAMITMIAGDAGPVLEDVILEGSAIMSLSFSRTHELQADDYSFDLLVAAGQRPDGLIAFFEKLDEDIGLPQEGEWLKTHPLSQKRIDNIKGKMVNIKP